MAEKKYTDNDIAQIIREQQFWRDPLGFILWAFPWDTDPQLQIVRLQEPWYSRYKAKYKGLSQWGPDAWACHILDDIAADVTEHAFDGRGAVPAVRTAVASGHGIGKSMLSAALVCWLMATRPFCKGTITANTAKQLETKTWAQIATWIKKSKVAHWFTLKASPGSMSVSAKVAPTEWFAATQTCRKENSEAFAGQHAASSSSFYLFDEGSAIDQIIYEVAEGGLTDGEPFFFVFGNPTRNSGKFYDIFHKEQNQWHCYKIDSREAQITNKEMIRQWEEKYGTESDFFKVRVRGEFPNAAVNQFIPSNKVDEAIQRQPPPSATRSAVCIVGADFARFGDDSTVFIARCGRDATFAVERWQKLSGAESARRLHEFIVRMRTRFGFSRVVCFGDAGGVGGPILDILRDIYHDRGIVDVQFGGKADDKTRFDLKRDEMWGRMRDWICEGGGCLPKDDSLRDDLTVPEYYMDKQSRVKLESKDDMKARGEHSPDAADALCLTFAENVSDFFESEDIESAPIQADIEYSPFD